MKEIKWIVGINLGILLLCWAFMLGFFYFQPVEDNVLITYSIIVGVVLVPAQFLINFLLGSLMFFSKRKAKSKAFLVGSIATLIVGSMLWYLGGYFLSKVHFEYFMP